MNDEVNIAKSTSQRSMITGHLLFIMPKVNYTEVLPVKNTTQIKDTKTNICKNGNKSNELKGTVDYKNIIINTNPNEQKSKQECNKNDMNLDLDDLPPLI